MKQNGPTRSEGLHNVTSQMDLCHHGAIVQRMSFALT